MFPIVKCNSRLGTVGVVGFWKILMENSCCLQKKWFFFFFLKFVLHILVIHRFPIKQKLASWNIFYSGITSRCLTKMVLVVNIISIFDGISSPQWISSHVKHGNHELACILLYDPSRKRHYDVWTQGVSWKWHQETWNITTILMK